MANMKTLTAANAIITLGVRNLLQPQIIKGFAADNIFDTDQVDNIETSMGVDGKHSAGWVPRAITQNFSLQADSDSNRFFEDLYYKTQQAKEPFIMFGSIVLPSVRQKLTMNDGYLKGYSPMANATITLQPRKFTIVWGTITGAVL